MKVDHIREATVRASLTLRSSSKERLHDERRGRHLADRLGRLRLDSLPGAPGELRADAETLTVEIDVLVVEGDTWKRRRRVELLGRTYGSIPHVRGDRLESNRELNPQVATRDAAPSIRASAPTILVASSRSLSSWVLHSSRIGLRRSLSRGCQRSTCST